MKHGEEVIFVSLVFALYFVPAGVLTPFIVFALGGGLAPWWFFAGVAAISAVATWWWNACITSN